MCHDYKYCRARFCTPPADVMRYSFVFIINEFQFKWTCIFMTIMPTEIGRFIIPISRTKVQCHSFLCILQPYCAAQGYDDDYSSYQNYIYILKTILYKKRLSQFASQMIVPFLQVIHDQSREYH